MQDQFGEFTYPKADADWLDQHLRDARYPDGLRTLRGPFDRNPQRDVIRVGYIDGPTNNVREVCSWAVTEPGWGNREERETFVAARLELAVQLVTSAGIPTPDTRLWSITYITQKGNTALCEHVSADEAIEHIRDLLGEGLKITGVSVPERASDVPPQSQGFVDVGYEVLKQMMEEKP